MRQMNITSNRPLDQKIRIRAPFNRSVNLTRDNESLDLVRSYLPTSRALAALTQIAAGLSGEPGSRALALIGPYGSGKSAFALFLGALLSGTDNAMQQAAFATLSQAEPALAQQFRSGVTAPQGFLRIQVNGIPDSLVRQLLLALATTVEHTALAPMADPIRRAAHPGIPMDQVLDIIGKVQQAWASAGGAGVLIEIDELGRFLEFDSSRPQQREIHLLQLLAEKAAETTPIPLQLVVMLHQSFEHYANRLGKNLRDEWQKVQGRFGTIAFLEPAEQSLRIIGAAFECNGQLAATTVKQLTEATDVLAAEGALPLGLDQGHARQLFERCYPLHPLTLLILPVLCQKVAQNERTLFSYLTSKEPFGLRERLVQMKMGDWIGPWELYDYFILNQAEGFSDPLTYHRWAEVTTALERLQDTTQGDTADPMLRLVKTIGLLNLIGVQRGLKASPSFLNLLFGKATTAVLKRLESASIIHFRQFSGEYRVWQGSDFNLYSALQQTAAEQSALSLVDILNNLKPLRPIVARRASIETGTLRSYEPLFTAREDWPPRHSPSENLALWFYLAEAEENPDLTEIPALAVVAVCHFTERLREVVSRWMALKELPRHHAPLQQDPVAQREYQAWLLNAETEAVRAINALLEEPEKLHWCFGGETRSIRGRRELQRELSQWASETCYPQAPLIRNELVNRERPSPSAATGRKRLLAAMLAMPERDELGIEKTPAEKSLYLSLLKESGLHRPHDGQWSFYPPPAYDPCRLHPLWNAISDTLGSAGERQVALLDLYAKLQQPPYGVRLGILPILVIAYLLAHRREVALYQEGAFCETLTIDQAELLCRRPALFSLERFELSGLRGDLFEQYMGSIVGNLRPNATLLDIVRPLLRFAGSLPEYTLHCANLSPETERVRNAFRQAKSPGALLFDALPRACDVDPNVFNTDDLDVIERFVARLIQVLRELKRAYPNLLEHWRYELSRMLLDTAPADLCEIRQELAERYRGLDCYAPDHSPVGAFIRRLADEGFPTDEAWLESVLTLLGNVPPAKWRESTRLQAELRLAELGGQLRELEQLRQAMADASNRSDAVLVKLVDPEQGEFSRVLRLSAKQRQAAADSAEQIAASLQTLDNSTQFAVVAALLKRFTANRPNEAYGND